MPKKTKVVGIVEIGDLVKDKVTGFEGVAVAKVEWLNGCIRYIVQARKVEKDSKSPEISVDVQQLELVAKDVTGVRADLKKFLDGFKKEVLALPAPETEGRTGGSSTIPQRAEIPR